MIGCLRAEGWEEPMTRHMVGLAFALLGAGSLRAADYEIKCALYQGDSKGTRAAGTLKLVSAPTLAAKSGGTSSLLVGGHVMIGNQMVPIGREVVVSPSTVDGGGVRVR